MRSTSIPLTNRLRPRTFLALFAFIVVGSFACALALPMHRYLSFQQLDNTWEYRARWVYERIQFDPTPTDIVVIGSSRSLYDVDAPLLEELLAARGLPNLHVANLSLPAPMVDLTKVIAERVMAARHPKLIIVGVEDQLQRWSHPAFKEFADVGDIISAPIIGNRFYLENLVHAAFRQIELEVVSLDTSFFGFDRHFDFDRYSAIPRDTTLDERFPDGHVLLHTTVQTEGVIAADRAQYVAGIRQPLLHGWIAPIEFSISMGGYRDIARAAKARGIPLVFCYLTYYKGPAQPDQLAFFRGVGEVFPEQWGPKDTRVFDDYRMFSDSVHLNRAGAAKETENLADWIAAEWSGTISPTAMPSPLNTESELPCHILPVRNSMTRDDVRSRVVGVLEDVLGRDDIDLNDQDSARTVEGWDSLSHIRIMAGIERKFGIRFTNAEFVKLLDVGDLIEMIENKMVGAA